MTTPSHHMSSISCPLSAIPPVPRSADFVGRVYDHLSSLLAPWPVVPVSFIGISTILSLFVCEFWSYC
ncbi:unnamed protein product [Prunus armeniaca]